MRYDLIVIGGGPAGYTGALRAAGYGAKVLLIESGELGGVCLNRGCIPTKSLIRSSSLYAGRSEWASMGIKAETIEFDQHAAYARKDGVSAFLRKGIAAALKNGGIEYVKGSARFESAHAVSVGSNCYEGENILVAIGSVPALPPVEGIEYAMTSDEVLNRPLAGERIAIIGCGVIGIEFATYLTGIGKSVVAIDAADRILPAFPADLCARLTQIMKRRGTEFYTSCKIGKIGETFIEAEDASGAVSVIECDNVICATGRKCELSSLKPENAGLKPEHFIEVDSRMRTSVASIYAAGDVTGGPQLAHYAAAQAKKAVDAMFGKPDSIDLSVVPACVYSSPEIAVVGEVPEGGQNVKYMLGNNGKSIINGNNTGFIKLFYDDKRRIRGAALFGDGVTEIIGELTLAIKNGMTASQVASAIHAHPTVYESISEACESINFQEIK